VTPARRLPAAPLGRQVPELRDWRRYAWQWLTEDRLKLDRHDQTGGGASPGESFLRLLYRYLWPFPYFRDVSRGQRMERQQNYRHNRAMRVHLPGFALKWALLTAFCFGAGSALGSLPVPLVVAACFFVTGTWTLVVSLLLLTAWCWLARFPELY
jgi:hypothetical protein